MKRIWRSALLGLLLVVSTSSARDPWTGPRSNPGECLNFGFAVDWLNLRRDTPQRVSLVQESTVVDAATVISRELSTDDGEFSSEAGYRLIAGVELTDCFVVEAIYSRLSSWNTTSSITPQTPGLFTLDSVFTNLDPTLTTGYTTTYVSTFWSGEAGTRYLYEGDGQLSASISTGFRYINIDENFRLVGTDTTLATEGTGAVTTNNLYGFQFGGDITYAFGEALYFTFIGKGGVYLNDNGHRIVTARTEGGVSTVRFDSSTRDSTTAVSVETGVLVNLRIAECALLRGGYQMLYVGGIALAPEQLDSNRVVFANTIGTSTTATFRNTTTELNNEGSTLFHGFTLGLEISY